ncbi:glutathione S-transferase family protein [Mesorhizobium sp. BHbdii]
MEGAGKVALYGRIGTGSAAVEAILEELGIGYVFIAVDRAGEIDSPGTYRQLNPLGEVPTLVTPSGVVLTESSAICIYLADIVEQPKLAPALKSEERGSFLRWMVFLQARTYAANLRYNYPHRYCTDGAGVDGVRAAAEEFIRRDWQLVSAFLGDRDYLVGASPTVCDVFMAMLITWSNGPDAAKVLPNLVAHYRRITARPSVAKVWERNEFSL